MNRKWISIGSISLAVLLGVPGCSTPEYSMDDLSLPAIQLIAQDSSTNSADLVDRLGCLGCHDGNGSQTIQKLAPPLNHAGSRWSEQYLTEYLQDPIRVRHHIGESRMPDFQLNKEESKAISAYLVTLKEEPTTIFPSFEIRNDAASINRGEELYNRLACTACHTTISDQKALVSNLASVGEKLNQEWLMNFLASPESYRGPENQMPYYFYTRNADALEPIYEQSSEMITDLAAYLMSLSSDEQARENEVSGDAVLGSRIFKGQNCVACHRTGTKMEPKSNSAPVFSAMGGRLKKDWTANFLKNPHPIRPFGYEPGSGSRMPDFDLTGQEIDALVGHLYDSQQVEKVEIQKQSRFSEEKTRSLLTTKYSCLGCHQLGEKGGNIAPKLTQVNQRLNSSYLAEMIENPTQAHPGISMPKIPLTENQSTELISFLFHNKEETTTEYLSLTDHQLIEFKADGVENNYLKYCASCHGVNGEGDGFNARYLKVVPTAHSDAEYLGERPDDALFDGIYNGGYILNKSHEMPAWGQTLSRAEITELVEFMRELCNCNGPAWSNDGSN